MRALRLCGARGTRERFHKGLEFQADRSVGFSAERDRQRQRDNKLVPSVKGKSMEEKRITQTSERSGSESEPSVFGHRDWQYRDPLSFFFPFCKQACGSDLAREPAASGLLAKV